MKKKLIAIAIAAAVAAPLTAQAIDLSGDARVRYYSNNVSEVNEAAYKQTGAQTDSRVGLNMKAKNEDGAGAVVRLELNNNHNGAGGSENDPTIKVDHAYIVAPVGMGVTVKGGKTIGNWGHKLYVWDTAGDRLHITKKMGDMAAGIVFTKANEDGLPTESNALAAGSEKDDSDTSVTTLWFKMGKMGGIRYDMKVADGADDTRDAVKSNTFDIYGGAPLGGGWGLGFEVTSTGGSNENVGGAKPDGSSFLLAAMGKVANVGLTVGYVSVQDGAATDNDLFTFAGTGTQPGSLMSSLGSAKDMYKMNALFAVAKGDMGKLGLEAGVGLIKMEDDSNSNVADVKETVVSVKANYKLGKVTNLKGQIGSFSGDMMKARHFGASIETKF